MSFAPAFARRARSHAGALLAPWAWIAGSVQVAEAADWAWFSSSEGAYAVEFPAQPTRSESRAPESLAGLNWTGTSVTWTVWSRHEQRLYGVTHLPLPDEIVLVADGPAPVIADRLESAAVSFGDRAAQPVRDGPGARLEARSPAGEVLQLRGEVAAGTLILAWVRGPAPSEGATRFLASLRPGRPRPATLSAVEAGFRVEMPGPAVVGDEVVATSAGVRRVRRYTAWLDGHRYSVGSADLQPPPKKPDAWLETARRDLLRSYGAKAAKDRKGRGERSFVFSVVDGSEIHCRYLLRSGRFFELTAHLVADGPPGAAVAQRFLESFQVVGP